MTACEVTDAELPNFNKDFYYNKPELQEKLQECYNTRVELHFGRHNAEKHHLFIDFKAMKHEFKNYEKWVPANRLRDQYTQGKDESDITAIIDRLKQKQHVA